MMATLDQQMTDQLELDQETDWEEYARWSEAQALPWEPEPEEWAEACAVLRQPSPAQRITSLESQLDMLYAYVEEIAQAIRQACIR